MPRGAGRRLVERIWISLFLVSGFLFAVLAPPWVGIALSSASVGMAVLDAWVHRGLVGTPWLVAAVTFGMLWLAIAVVAAVTGAASGLALFTP